MEVRSVENITKQMQEIANRDDDPEADHCKADYLLREALLSLEASKRIRELLNAYEKVRKWYA